MDLFTDYFVRSKLEDKSDHITATAMVRNDQEKERKIYIAKNQSASSSQPLVSSAKPVKNENVAFADMLVRWFHRTTSQNESDKDNLAILETICRFNWLRLEHYIQQTQKFRIKEPENDPDLVGLSYSLRDG